MSDKLLLVDDQANTEETEEEPGLRMVLVGKTGAGKSATGNTILGTMGFKSKLSSSSVTSTCQKEKCLFSGQNLSVVDTPGLFETSKSKEEVKSEILRCISFISPGPHVFLYVIKPERFTAEEKEAINVIKQIFGEKATDYIMALFTCGDNLEADGGSIEEYIDDNPALSSFISQCGGRYHLFNNRNEDPSQVKELLKKINKMVERNGGTYFTNGILEEAGRAIREEMKQIMIYNPGIKVYEARCKAEKNNNFLLSYHSALGLGVGLTGAAGAGAAGGPEKTFLGNMIELLVGAIIWATEKKPCVIQ